MGARAGYLLTKADELPVLGDPLATGPLILWAHQQVNGASGKEQGLQRLGISVKDVAELRSLLEKVEGIQTRLEHLVLREEISSMKDRLYQLTCSLARALRLEPFLGPIRVPVW